MWMHTTTRIPTDIDLCADGEDAGETVWVHIPTRLSTVRRNTETPYRQTRLEYLFDISKSNPVLFTVLNIKLTRRVFSDKALT